MDPTESKPAGWYPSSRTPGMERYWNGDFWTGKYRPAEELQGQFGIAPNEPEEDSLSEKEEETPQDVWAALDGAKGDPSTPTYAPGVQQEYTSGGLASYDSRNSSYPAYAPYAPVKQSQQGLSVVAMVLAFFVPLAGAIVGHVAYGKAKKANASTGLSLAAIIVGWINFGLSLFIWIPILLAFAGVFSSAGNSSYTDEPKSSGDYTYTAPSGNEVPNYLVGSTAEDQLNKQYPGYNFWYVSCEDNLPVSTETTISCNVTVYPFADTNEYEDFTATVGYAGGTPDNPTVTVKLDREPTSVAEFPRN